MPYFSNTEPSISSSLLPSSSAFFSYGPLNWIAMANFCMATPNVLILEANTLRENPSCPRGLNKHQFFKEPIRFDGYYFTPSGKSGLGYEYDEKFVVDRKKLA